MPKVFPQLHEQWGYLLRFRIVITLWKMSSIITHLITHGMEIIDIWCSVNFNGYCKCVVSCENTVMYCRIIHSKGNFETCIVNVLLLDELVVKITTLKLYNYFVFLWLNQCTHYISQLTYILNGCVVKMPTNKMNAQWKAQYVWLAALQVLPVCSFVVLYY
jgi:hypothetical protein